jgi:hypothetical protein
LPKSFCAPLSVPRYALARIDTSHNCDLAPGETPGRTASKTRFKQRRASRAAAAGVKMNFFATRFFPVFAR